MLHSSRMEEGTYWRLVLSLYNMRGGRYKRMYEVGKGKSYRGKKSLLILLIFVKKSDEHSLESENKLNKKSLHYKRIRC